MAKSWYLIRTKPQSEYIAASALRREQFELFFPRVTTPEPQSSREDMPLFPGYLFLRHDLESEDSPEITRLPGVLGWVRFDGVVPSIPDEIISYLSRRVDEINSTGGLWTRFKPGELVRVVTGKLDTLAQVLEEPNSPQDRIRVLLEFMGRTVSAEVDLSSLYPASQGSEVQEKHRRSRRTRGKGRWIRGAGPRAAVSA